jgi:hypothetical protein
MALDTTVEYPGSVRGRQVERACIVLLQSELDIAFGFLRLADVETGSGKNAHADALIAKANSSYKTVLNSLPTVPLEFEEERQLLREGVRMLQDTIRAVARRRQC